MSTHLETLRGYKEDIDEAFSETRLHITRFSGGQEGMMLQLTIDNPDGYIQLTQQDVRDLHLILGSAFDKDVYPSD